MYPNLNNCNKVWQIKTNSDLLDKITIDSRVNVDILKVTVYERVGDCTILYKFWDDISYLKKCIDAWFWRNREIISKLIDTNHFDYNPIHNYDRTEIRKLQEDKTNTERSGGESGTKSSGDALLSKSAYNNDTMVGDSRNDSTSSSASNYTNDTVSTGKTGVEEGVCAYGNIGVTTTQDMIRQERDIVQFDVYVWIADHLEEEICTCIY